MPSFTSAVTCSNVALPIVPRSAMEARPSIQGTRIGPAFLILRLLPVSLPHAL